MTKTIKITTLAMLIAAAACGLNFSSVNSKVIAEPEKAETFILDLVVNSLHEMSWDPISGTGSYMVTIRNLSTNILHSQFSTTATSSLVYGLVSGCGYRITISRGSTWIVVDDIAS